MGYCYNAIWNFVIINFWIFLTFAEDVKIVWCLIPKVILRFLVILWFFSENWQKTSEDCQERYKDVLILVQLQSCISSSDHS